MANGTYVEQAELDEESGLPRFVHSEDGGRAVRYEDGYWTQRTREYSRYKQRFDPLSPAPKADGWELATSGRAPAPTVQPSWERELRMGGRDVYRQEGAAGDGARPRFRCKPNTGWTVEWAAGEGGAGRWEWHDGTGVWYYNESAEQLPPRAVNRAAGPNTNP